MTDDMRTEALIIRLDEGEVNQRILNREIRADFRRVESAGIKLPMRLDSAEGKRIFVRFFSNFQLNVHYISVIGRVAGSEVHIRRLEGTLRDVVDKATKQVDAALDDAELLFKTHGIKRAASFSTVPLELDVTVFSATGRRYLEAMAKLDQLMPLLQTLEIYEVLKAEAVDALRTRIKRKVREPSQLSREMAIALSKEFKASQIAAAKAARATAAAVPDSPGPILEPAPAPMAAPEAVPVQEPILSE
jgi:hypothetical protein